MKATITAAANISPQHTYGEAGFPEVYETSVTNRLTCIEPDYRAIINPVLLRRMPRILKMGLASSQLCISRSGIIQPDAIIVGTGLGCLHNLEQFLLEILNNNEHITSVLPFINSTHNAVASQIAILLKNHNYNVTYCHRGFSFESALLDALMHIEEKKAEHILVGGIDECTDDFMHLHSYLHYWKDPVESVKLLENETIGTIAGEGSVFFMLSDHPGKDSSVILRGVNTFLTSADAPVTDIIAETDLFLNDCGINRQSLDLVLLGMNGDVLHDEIYHELRHTYFSGETGIAVYKPLCGEYYTSSAFALWFSMVVLEQQDVPAPVSLSPVTRKKIQNILIYNQLRNVEHSLMLVTRD
jgi:3-oxoacyl-[acyl-carrier-protein] synthase II